MLIRRQRSCDRIGALCHVQPISSRTCRTAFAQDGFARCRALLFRGTSPTCAHPHGSRGNTCTTMASHSVEERAEMAPDEDGEMQRVRKARMDREFETLKRIDSELAHRQFGEAVRGDGGGRRRHAAVQVQRLFRGHTARKVRALARVPTRRASAAACSPRVPIGTGAAAVQRVAAE